MAINVRINNLPYLVDVRDEPPFSWRVNLLVIGSHLTLDSEQQHFEIPLLCEPGSGEGKRQEKPSHKGMPESVHLLSIAGGRSWGTPSFREEVTGLSGTGASLGHLMCGTPTPGLY